jgi:hypothetical protein
MVYNDGEQSHPGKLDQFLGIGRLKRELDELDRFCRKKLAPFGSFVALNDTPSRSEGHIGPENLTIVSVSDRFIPGNRMFSAGIYIARKGHVRCF